ncbi:hypothetical protein N658DRAFT_512329 [Parathielavia hyrcaniae]|uniref:Xaa-Pro aminopeptidase n=1 Tax=Parathielavia hyrcaniae TaxID=113614 RepID=A0AAN6QA79_9PEZI|nr:hypothetical protein N658DRAFT_512329 [Parathielavia hyrcaniae]
MDDTYTLVPVDEFEALSIELKPSSPPQQRPKRNEGVSTCSPSEPKETSPENNTTPIPLVNNRLDKQWLYQDVGKYPAKTHARKVARELGVKCGVVYLVGQEEKVYEDSDQGPEFRQRRYFYYISGADFPGCAATYDIAADELVLWIPQIEPRKVLWYGRTPTPRQCMDVSEVDHVRYIKDLNRALLAKVKPGTIIYALHPDQVPRLAEHHKGTVQIDTIKLKPAIECARVIKTDHEIALIRRANAISSAAHKAVLTRAKHQRNERDLQAIFTAYCVAHGARHQAYPVIAASGPNASTLHYADNDAPLHHARHVVVLDAGAEWRCYASDVTRTFPLLAAGRFPSPQAAAVYRAVERMQDECVERVRPGVPFYALHLHACAVGVAELLGLGILCGGTVAEILGRGTVAAFFPHGLGHHVGLEVHDVSGRERLLLSSRAAAAAAAAGPGGGKVLSKREFVGPEQVAALYQELLASPPECGMTFEEGEAANAGGKQKLERNMVVTIEPGIYFCREYIEGYFLNDPYHSRYINKEELDKYWDVGGVRIEDDILVTDNGYENLTWAPKGQDMLKEIEEARPF